MAEKVEIQSDAKERVAYDLMIKIASLDQTPGPQRDKKYWLGLYRQCFKATIGCDIETVLDEK